MTLNPESCGPCSRLSGERRLTVKTIAFLLAVLTFGILPCLSAAQGILPVQWLQNSINGANSIAYSPDGTHLAVCGSSGLQIVTNASGATIGVPTSIDDFGFGTQAVAFSPDGTLLAVCGNSQTVGGNSNAVLEIWSVETNTLVATYTEAGYYTLVVSFASLAFSPDGTKIVVVGSFENSGSVTVLSALTGESLGELDTPAQGLSSVAFSPDGSEFVIGGGDNSGGFLETRKFPALTLVRTFATSAQSYVQSVVISPDGSTLADCAINPSSQTIECWSMTNGTLLTTLSAPNQQYSSVVFSPDSSSLAVGGANTTINGGGLLEMLSVTNLTLEATFATGETGVYAVAFSPDGGTLADAGGYPGLLEQWNVATLNLTASKSTGYLSAVESTVFSDDGGTLVIGATALNGDGLVQVWNVATGLVAESIDLGKVTVYSVALSYDETTLACCGTDANSNGFLEIWDVATGVLLYSLSPVSNTKLLSVVFSPDGSKLAICGHGPTLNVQIIDAQSYGLLASWGPNASVSINCVVFSPDGNSVFLGGYSAETREYNQSGYLQEWSWNSNEGMAYLTTTGAVSSVAVSPDGTILADGGYAGSLETTLV